MANHSAHEEAHPPEERLMTRRVPGWGGGPPGPAPRAGSGDRGHGAAPDQTAAAPSPTSADDESLRHDLGDAVYTLTTCGSGWTVACRPAHAGQRAWTRWYGGRYRAERAYFAAIAAKAFTHKPYVCEVPIGGAHLIVARIAAYWILAEKPSLQVAAVFDNERDACDEWVDRGEHLLRKVAGAERRRLVVAADDIGHRPDAAHSRDQRERVHVTLPGCIVDGLRHSGILNSQGPGGLAAATMLDDAEYRPYGCGFRCTLYGPPTVIGQIADFLDTSDNLMPGRMRHHFGFRACDAAEAARMLRTQLTRGGAT